MRWSEISKKQEKKLQHPEKNEDFSEENEKKDK